LSPFEITLLIAAGLVAGVVNTLAGGGSLLTVPILVVLGLPGTVANGTNRVGVLVQCLVSVWRFNAEGVSEFRSALPLLAPIALGSGIGAIGATYIPDHIFEAIFGIIMLILLVPMLRSTKTSPELPTQLWPSWKTMSACFAIGVYGGAFQAGVGILLLLVLHRGGLDLVRANAVKMIVSVALTLVAVPVFIAKGQVDWLPAVILAIGFTMGATLGTRLAIRGGERVIRPAIIIAVLALSCRMMGLY
jgi:hypothetical protein